VGKARDATKYPTMPRTVPFPPQQRTIQPNISSLETALENELILKQIKILV
jgi:hypothetical protein